MHYKDGTEAQIGDIARGKGYNLLYPVQGVVVGLTPGSGSCDIHVLALYGLATPAGAVTNKYPAMYEEHGTCADFELVYRVGMERKA